MSEPGKLDALELVLEEIRAAVREGRTSPLDVLVRFREELYRKKIETGRRQAEQQGLVACSFCGKSQQQVRHLIAGPDVYICNECVLLCNDIAVASNGAKEPGPPPGAEPEGT